MTIWDTIDAGPLLELQQNAEGGMTNPCRIDRVIGITVDELGNEVPAFAPVVYEGPCKIRSYRPYEEARDVAGGTVTTQRYDVHIPAVSRIPALLADGVVTTWAGPVRVGDYATVTMGGLERVFRIGAPHHLTRQTAQRMLGDEVLGGIPARP